MKNDIIFIFTLLCGVSERFHPFEAAKRSVKIKNVIFPLIQLGQQGLGLHFVKLPTYAIFVSSVMEIHINNTDTSKVTNTQYYKIILF